MSKQGSLFIISAPSGAGKTSLVRALVSSLKDIKVSISHTTRALRPGDCGGVDYYFVSEPQFETMIANHVFLEYAKVYHCYYGTSRQWVMEQLQQGIDVLLEIDWQGALQVMEKFPKAVSVFILPPSIVALRQRLLSRRQDSSETIEKRMSLAKSEIIHYDQFRYIVVNDDFEMALQELRQIVLAQRLKCVVRKPDLVNLLAELLQNQ